MPEPSGPRATFGQRFGASLIDGFLIWIVAVVLGLVFRPLGGYIGIAIAIAYFGYLEGSPSGQTIGKRAVGIRVIDFDTGGPIGTGRALLRYVGRWVSALVFLLGYFWMLWDKERQCWHDKFANDVVVPVDAYPVERWPG
jgi:uncharacterized RDD family membrane protein YckC